MKKAMTDMNGKESQRPHGARMVKQETEGQKFDLRARTNRPFGLAFWQIDVPIDFNKPDPEIEALFAGDEIGRESNLKQNRIRLSETVREDGITENE